jgi:hypothetical protein
MSGLEICRRNGVGRRLRAPVMFDDGLVLWLADDVKGWYEGWQGIR